MLGRGATETIGALQRVPLGRKDTMLQWKPRIYVVLTLGTLAAASFLGALAEVAQFGW